MTYVVALFLLVALVHCDRRSDMKSAFCAQKIDEEMETKFQCTKDNRDVSTFLSNLI